MTDAPRSTSRSVSNPVPHPKSNTRVFESARFACSTTGMSDENAAWAYAVAAGSSSQSDAYESHSDMPAPYFPPYCSRSAARSRWVCPGDRGTRWCRSPISAGELAGSAAVGCGTTDSGCRTAVDHHRCVSTGDGERVTSTAACMSARVADPGCRSAIDGHGRAAGLHWPPHIQVWTSRTSVCVRGAMGG